MITFEEAINIATKKQQDDNPEINWGLEHVSEFNEGWFFYFNSKKYLETLNILDRPLGLGPIIVGKDSGTVFQTGQSFNDEYWIARFLEYIKNQQ